MENANNPVWQTIALPDAPDLDLPRGRFRRNTERIFTFYALNAARRDALRVNHFNLTRDRYIILSDTHKGNRQRGADEFQINDDLYCHALDYYLERGYRLILNGDIEEGWKARYPDIIDAYESTAFAKERSFAEQGPDHYLRTYGNHDEDWADPRLVNAHLWPALGRSVRVYAAVLLGDRIMITHGHQGELKSDRISWISRRAVRHVWRPIQRFLNYTPRRIAQNYGPSHPRDPHLLAWAKTHRMMLIAGHTHQSMLPNPRGGLYYVNDGCCIHHRSLTAIEIDQGELRLVKWSAPPTPTYQRRVMQRGDLGALLAAL